MKFTQEEINSIVEVFSELKDSKGGLWISKDETVPRIRAAQSLVDLELFNTTINADDHFKLTTLGSSTSKEDLKKQLEDDLRLHHEELDLLEEEAARELDLREREEAKHELEMRVLHSTLSSERRERWLTYLVFGSLLIQFFAWLVPEPLKLIWPSKFDSPKEQTIEVAIEQAPTEAVIEIDSVYSNKAALDSIAH